MTLPRRALSLAGDAPPAGAAAIQSPWHSAFAAVVDEFFRAYCPLTVTGMEHLPVNQSFLLCSNHASHLDGAALMAATMRTTGNRCILLAAQDYFFDRPIRRRLVSALVPVEPMQRRPKRNELAASVTRLQGLLAAAPRTVVIFPEGTRSATGEIAPFKRGVGVMAQSLGIPILPAAIAGTFHSLPRGALRPRPGPVRVAFGRLIYPEGAGMETAPVRISRSLVQAAEASVRTLWRDVSA